MVIQHFGNNVVKGGMRRLPLALAHFLEAHGGRIRVNAQVKRILVENGEAVGVELLDGEQISTRRTDCLKRPSSAPCTRPAWRKTTWDQRCQQNAAI